MKPKIRDHFFKIQFQFFVFLILTLLVSGLVIWTHQKLPEEIAVHFAADNSPNRFSSKWEMTIVMLAILIFDWLLFAAIALFLPVLPTSLVNMPNKDVMLSPENGPKNFAYLSNWTLVIGSATAFFMGIIHWDVFLANTARENQHLGFSGAAIIFYLTVVVIAVVALLIKCYRKQETAER